MVIVLSSQEEMAIAARATPAMYISFFMFQFLNRVIPVIDSASADCLFGINLLFIRHQGISVDIEPQSRRQNLL
jgi:hypothetical protein